MKIIPILLTSITAFTLASCGSDNKSNGPEELPPLEDIPSGPINTKLVALAQPAFKDKTTTASDRDAIAFAKIRQLCEQGGNRFNERHRECECAAVDGVPALWRATVASRENKDSIAGKCVSSRVLKPDPKVAASFAEALLKGDETFVFELHKASVGEGKQHAVPSYLVAFDANKKEKQKRNEQFAAKLDAAPLFYDPIPAYFGPPNIEAIRMFYDESVIDYALETSTGAWIIHRRTEDAFTNLRFSTYGNTLDHLGPMLSRFNPKKGNKWQLPPLADDSPDRDEAARLGAAATAYRAYLDGQAEAPEGFERDVLITENGCHIRCSVREKFQFEGEWFSYEKFYLFGQVVHERLNRYAGPGIWHGVAFESSVVFNRGGGVSMIMIAERSFKPFASSWQFRFYDDLGKLTGSKSGALAKPEQAGQFEAALNLDNPDIARSAPVVLVDRPIEFEYQHVTKWIKKGPRFSNGANQNNDLLGWLDIPESNSPGKKMLEFYDGFLDNAYGMRRETGHGAIVANTIVKDSNRQWPVSVIPTSALNLGSDMGRIKRIIESSRARVVNMSQGFQIEGRESCPANNFHVPDEVIWVVSAGNDGLVNSTDMCHPMMAPRYRTITVAATDESGMNLEYYSDRGRRYADIGAYGSDTFEGSKVGGTSIAAPRVSRVLGKLVFKYGKVLNNQLIRLAVLLSAKVDVNNRMDTRTGGSLNEEGAMRVADYMTSILLDRISFPAQSSRKDLMFAMIKRAGVLKSDAEIESQVDYLLESGIF